MIGIRDQKCDGFFSRQFFALFFCFCTIVLKKTHTREETHYDAQKDKFLSLRNNINTLRTKTHRREKAGNNNLRFLFLFSLVVSEGVLYTYTSKP
jgi:hypothetical protein